MSATSFDALATLMRQRNQAGLPPYRLVLGDEDRLSAEVLRNQLQALGQAVDERADKQVLKTLWIDYCAALSNTERTALLRQAVDAQEVTPGLRDMARLTAAGYFNHIFTTDVSSLPEQALQDAGLRDGEDYVVLRRGGLMDDGAIIEQFSHDSPRVKLVKLHGDVTLQTASLTWQELFDFGPLFSDFLEQELSQNDVLIVGHDAPYSGLNRCIGGGSGTLHYVFPTKPHADFLRNLVHLPRFNYIPTPEGEPTEGIFADLAERLLVIAPALPGPQPRIREAWAIWSFPFYLPGFTPDALRQPFDALARPLDDLDDEEQYAFDPWMGEISVPDFGKLVLDLDEDGFRRYLWLPSQSVRGPRSGLAFLPYLVDVPWRPHWSDPDTFSDHFRVTARLRFRLYPAGACIVHLVIGIRGLDQAAGVTDLIHLLKHLSPGDSNKRAFFDVGGHLARQNIPTDELLPWLVDQLALRLYRDGRQPTLPASTAWTRHGRTLYLYDTDPVLTPAEHGLPVFGLFNLHSAWERVDENQVARYLISDFGWERGDWNLLEGSRALLYTPGEVVERSRQRRNRRLFFWRVVTGIELALVMDVLLREVPEELSRCEDANQQARLTRLADDLAGLSTRLPTYQRKVYARVAEALHISRTQELLRATLARRQQAMLSTGLERLSLEHAQLVGGQARIEEKLERLSDDLLREVARHERFLASTVAMAFERGMIAQGEMQETLNVIIAVLEEIRLRQAEMPAQLVDQSEQAADIIGEPGLDIAHKLKVCIPIIPMLLAYEGEISLSQKANLEAAWQRLTEWVRERI
jgi:hypothetical protein